MSKMSELHAEQQQAERLTDVTRPPTFEQSARAGRVVSISETGLSALQTAAKRERGNVCPIPGVSHRGGVERLVLQALERRGLIYYPLLGIPCITNAGRAVVAAAKGGA